MALFAKSVRAIFDEASEMQEPEQRGEFIERACKGDAALRRETEELLAAHQTAGGFLADPKHDGTARLTMGEGELVGQYKLLEKIGEGGCGIVFMAEQTRPVRRRVAVKVIKLGM